MAIGAGLGYFAVDTIVETATGKSAAEQVAEGVKAVTNRVFGTKQ